MRLSSTAQSVPSGGRWRIDNFCQEKCLGSWQEQEHGCQTDSQGGACVAAGSPVTRTARPQVNTNGRLDIVRLKPRPLTRKRSWGFSGSTTTGTSPVKQAWNPAKSFGGTREIECAVVQQVDVVVIIIIEETVTDGGRGCRFARETALKQRKVE